MPPDITLKIDTKDVEAMLKAIEDEATKRRLAERVADDVVLPALSRDKYPAPSGNKQPFKSDKARRYFFAALADGAIQVPYQRTGDTGASYQKEAIADGITVRSTKASAAFTRGGGPDQAAYHRPTWATHEELADSLEGEAAKVATEEIVDIIGEAAP